MIRISEDYEVEKDQREMNSERKRYSGQKYAVRGDKDKCNTWYGMVC